MVDEGSVDYNGLTRHNTEFEAIFGLVHAIALPGPSTPLPKRSPEAISPSIPFRIDVTIRHKSALKVLRWGMSNTLPRPSGFSTYQDLRYYLTFLLFVIAYTQGLILHFSLAQFQDFGLETWTVVYHVSKLHAACEQAISTNLNDIAQNKVFESYLCDSCLP